MVRTPSHHAMTPYESPLTFYTYPNFFPSLFPFLNSSSQISVQNFLTSLSSNSFKMRYESLAPQPFTNPSSEPFKTHLSRPLKPPLQSPHLLLENHWAPRPPLPMVLLLLHRQHSHLQLRRAVHDVPKSPSCLSRKDHRREIAPETERSGQKKSRV
jgi:hypothetical protein